MAIGQGFHAKPSPTLGSLPAGLKLLVVPQSLAINISVFPTPKPFPNFLQPHSSSRVRLVFASVIFFTGMARDKIKTLIVENSL